MAGPNLLVPSVSTVNVSVGRGCFTPEAGKGFAATTVAAASTLMRLVNICIELILIVQVVEGVQAASEFEVR